MNIYNKPYTYLIGWTQHNKYYYGARFAKNCHPDDLWKKYFTSSYYVKQFREQYGEPDVIQVRQTFDNADSALAWESKVLHKMNVMTNDTFLNQAIGGIWGTSNLERNKKISESRKGFKVSDATKSKLSAIVTEWHKHNTTGMQGRNHSPKTIAIMKQKKQGSNHPMSGRKQEVIKCPHCSKEVGVNMAKRWHLDNCKMR